MSVFTKGVLICLASAILSGIGVFTMSAADGHPLGQAALYGIGTVCFGIALAGIFVTIVVAT
jgi:hypothetical protein